LRFGILRFGESQIPCVFDGGRFVAGNSQCFEGMMLSLNGYQGMPKSEGMQINISIVFSM